MANGLLGVAVHPAAMPSAWGRGLPGVHGVPELHDAVGATHRSELRISTGGVSGQGGGGQNRRLVPLFSHARAVLGRAGAPRCTPAASFAA